jgi:glucose/mannose transport system substrate-binding protein
VPVNIHSNYWAWYSKDAMRRPVAEPRNFAEFIATAPQAEGSHHSVRRGRRRNGWQIQLLFQDMLTEALGVEGRNQDV